MASGIQAVILRLRDEELGVDIAHILEVAKMMDITRINDPAGFIKGVVNLRGRVITVVDLAGQFGFPDLGKIPRTARIVFVQFRKKIFGFVVDRISDMTNISMGDAGSSSDNVRTVVPKNYIKGVGRTVQGPIVVLDIEKIFLKFIKG